jgi:hypothetical protein
LILGEGAGYPSLALSPDGVVNEQMNALALSDAQLAELKLAAGTLPVEMRTDLLRLVAAHMNIEGETTDAAFGRALAFALSTLPAGGGPGACSCSR